MTKEDKFEIGLTLNKVAMLLSDEDFNKVKDLLKHVEQIVAEQTELSTEEFVQGMKNLQMEVKQTEQTERSVCDLCVTKNRGIPCGTEPRVCLEAVKLAVQNEPKGEE